MKKTFIYGLLAVTVFVSGQVQAQSGIPTLDVNSVQQLNALLDQLQTAKTQLEQTKRQLDALTQSSGFGYVMSNPSVQDAIRGALPNDAAALLDRLESQSSELSSSVQQITQAVDAPVNFAQDKIDMKAKSIQIAATKKALSEQAYNAMTKRLEVIDELQAKINTTTNPKEIAELQARIAIEQANIQTDQTRIQLANQQLEAEQTLLEARAEKVYSGWFSDDTKNIK
ncbi:MAG: type IV secretion system protein [Advenella sp.]|nr:type IV secretion system protein [Advenella sp.]